MLTASLVNKCTIYSEISLLLNISTYIRSQHDALWESQHGNGVTEGWPTWQKWNFEETIIEKMIYPPPPMKETISVGKDGTERAVGIRWNAFLFV